MNWVEEIPDQISGTKHAAISQALRFAVLRGELSPGEKLPCRRDLEQSFGVTNMTIQRAIDLLKRDGYIYSRGRWGVHVDQAPPCLHHFALVFPKRKQVSGYAQSLQFQALVDAAAAAQRWGPDRFEIYDDVAPGRDGGRPTSNYVRLLDDIRELRLAGLIFGNSIHTIPDDPIVTEGSLPRLALASGSRGTVGNVASDREALLKRAMQHLVDAGRTRVGFVVASDNGMDDIQICRNLLSQYSLPCEDVLTQGLHTRRPQWARNAIMLMAALPPDARPDGLIVGDDHFVPHVVSGLMATDLKVPRDLLVVGHANFPLREPDSLPITRLGFDACEVLASGLSVLRRERESGRSECETVDARFGFELEQSGVDEFPSLVPDPALASY